MQKIMFLTFASNPITTGKYEGIQSAAKRLKSQAEATKEFVSSIVVGWDDIYKYTNINNLYIPVDPNMYLFTPLLAKMAISGFFGHADVYFYAGAGCEIVNNKFAKTDFKQMINRVNKWGIYAEGTRYKDVSWCKNELIELLKSPESHLESGQTQATFFIISAHSATVDKVTSLIDEWVTVSLINSGFYIGNQFDPKKQSDIFISPRYDQSIFSLLLKKHNFRIFREKRRGFGKVMPTLRGSNTFLHTSRNRTGASCLPRHINNANIGFLSMIVRPLLNFHDFISDKYGVRKQYREFDPRTIADESVWPTE